MWVRVVSLFGVLFLGRLDESALDVLPLLATVDGVEDGGGALVGEALEQEWADDKRDRERRRSLEEDVVHLSAQTHSLLTVGVRLNLNMLQIGAQVNRLDLVSKANGNTILICLQWIKYCMPELQTRLLSRLLQRNTFSLFSLSLSFPLLLPLNIVDFMRFSLYTKYVCTLS